jgi:hypothetical protein
MESDTSSNGVVAPPASKNASQPEVRLKSRLSKTPDVELSMVQ